MRRTNIFHLGVKEMWSLARDPIMVLLIVYAFTLTIYTISTALPDSLTRRPSPSWTRTSRRSRSASSTRSSRRCSARRPWSRARKWMRAWTAAWTPSRSISPRISSRTCSPAARLRSSSTPMPRASARPSAAASTCSRSCSRKCRPGCNVIAASSGRRSISRNGCATTRISAGRGSAPSWR